MLIPAYGSQMVQKLINIVMVDGKKSIARVIVYDAIDILIKKAQGDKNKALDLFYKGFEQLIPLLKCVHEELVVACIRFLWK